MQDIHELYTELYDTINISIQTMENLKHNLYAICSEIKMLEAANKDGEPK